jgi:protein-L-isoaspartate(D-aspartate) O-methyltransferase
VQPIVDVEKLERQKRALLYYWEKEETVTDARVLAAFKAVPRERFMPDEYAGEAYVDEARPLPGGQTISQPTTVVQMLQALDVRDGMKVLEVGTGSGYNAALLARLAGPKGRVFSVEIVPELAAYARKRLAAAGARTVTVVEADGSKGLAKHAPYDRIIVTAGAPELPPPLIVQLNEGGIIVIPVGIGLEQALVVGRKRLGQLEMESRGAYAFVPLRGEHGIDSTEGSENGIEEQGEEPYDGEE